MKKALVLTSMMVLPALSWADDCEYSREIDLTMSVSGTDLLLIEAQAGTLVVTGDSGDGEVEIEALVCASSEKWLEEAALETREGDTARVSVDLPEVDGSWLNFGNRYVRMDLELRVPGNLALDIKDSSGSMKLLETGSANIKDSAGSIYVENARGDIEVRDTSGSMKFDGVAGDLVIVSDSSGSISGDNIEGSVLVKRDSSGSIRFSNVEHDFTVERDSSGSISANGVGGDFAVLKDGSGGINATNVAGKVSTPDND